MKIALTGQKYSDQAMIVDVELPDVVKKAIDAIYQVWKTHLPSIIPQLRYDVQTSHGPDDIGLVFEPTLWKKFPELPISIGYQQNISVRISSGFKRKNREGTQRTIDPKEFNRMHFSVSGSRGFILPESPDQNLDKNI